MTKKYKPVADRPPQLSEREEFLKDWNALTPEQQSFMRKIRAGRSDPVYFTEVVLGVPLHDGQKVWLWVTTRTCLDKAFELGLSMGIFRDRAHFDSLISKTNGLKNILQPSNRWGKTVVTSCKHIWYCFYKIGARGTWEQVAKLECGTLNLSPHSNQAEAGFELVENILKSQMLYVLDGVSNHNVCLIPDFLVSSVKQSRQHNFKNGTNYKAVPTGEDQASSLAGTPRLYISYDECAQSLHLKEELPAKIMSRLIDFGGPLDLISTPETDKPSQQYFFHLCKKGLKGEEGWYTQLGKITDNVFLGAEERDKVLAEILATDPAKYRQVAFGEFVSTGKKMFEAVVIERLWDKFGVDPATLIPIHGHQYLVWADWGFSDTGDPTVFYIIDYTQPKEFVLGRDKPRYRVAYREAHRGASPFEMIVRARVLCREWNGAKFGHDASAMGGVMLKKMMMETGMRAVDVIDFNGSGGNKADMLFAFIVAITDGRAPRVEADGKVTETKPDFGRVRSFHIPELEAQMGNYQYNPEKGVSDKRLEQDDIMCLGMAIWWLEKKWCRMGVKAVSFNPFAPTADKIADPKKARPILVPSTTVPERRIM